MKKLLLLLLITVSAFGQVGINTSNPQAVLDITSTTSGILIPRLTTTERNAIAIPVNSTRNRMRYIWKYKYTSNV